MMNPLIKRVRVLRSNSQSSNSAPGTPTPPIPRRLTRFAWIGLLAGATVLGGWVPSIVSSSSGLTLSLDRSVMAQTPQTTVVSAAELANFVRSALSMEPMRKQALQEIRAVMSQVPSIRCDMADSFNALDPRVRGVAIKYCNASKRIVESNNMTVARFNEIYVQQRSDTKLRERIQAETCRIAPEVCQK